MKIVVIGGGVIGLGTALELKRLAPALEVQVLEKEPHTGRHQSTHNSGVLHAGLYYKPGSLKAELAVRGIRRMTAFCREHGIAHEICGKLVVATDEAEMPRLKTLLERGTQNGLAGLQWLSAGQLREIEPHAAGIAAVRVPEEGIADYAGVCATMEKLLRAQGAVVTVSAPVRRIRRDNSGWRIETDQAAVAADFFVNCAGLHCDRVAAGAGEKRATRIVPFRGEYYRLRREAEHLVRHLIYPVPDPTFPFLGVHFTRLIHGGIEAGPNAVLALSREGYSKWTFSLRDAADALLFPGLWKFLGAHRAMSWEELKRSCSKRLFCESLQRLVPEVQERDLEPGGAGVRAQAMQPDGTLVQDFQFVERPGALHVLNAPSPGATASLAIGELISRKVLQMSGWVAATTPAVFKA